MKTIILLYFFTQLSIKGEILPEKTFYFRGEPICLKVILKNRDNKAWRITRPTRYNGTFKIMIYWNDKYLRHTWFFDVTAVIAPPQTIEKWKEWANIILNPGDSAIFYFPLSTFWGGYFYIFKDGKYLLKKIIYSNPYISGPKGDIVPSLQIPIWKDTLILEMNKEIIVKKPRGKLKEIYDKWMWVRKKVILKHKKDYSLYFEVLKICPDTSPYFPNILSECLNYIEPKRYWIKKFLNTYLYHPFAIKYISDKKWVEENVLPYGKEFIDSLPDKVKNEIYKTLKRGW